MNFVTNDNTLRQLEFTELTEKIAYYAHTNRGRIHLLEHSISCDPIWIEKEIRLVFECWVFLKEIGSISSERWCDLSSVEPGWQIENKTLSISSLIVFKAFISHYEFIFQAFSNNQIDIPNLFNLVKNVLPLKELKKQFEKVFNDDGEILDSASPELSQIRSEINTIQRKIQIRAGDLLDSFNKEGFLTTAQLTIKNGRLVLPFSAEFKRKIPGFIHDVSGSGQTVFIEPQELVNMNNQLFELRGEENVEIQRILTELSEKLRVFKYEILKMEKLLVHLDHIHAKAKFLTPFKITIPTLQTRKIWKIRNGIHPLLMLSRKSKNLQTIPLEFEMGETDEQFILISGPNAGGKSVAMKTIGILQLMVQSGMPIPVEENSSLPVIEGVFSVIGDNQSISNDLSSFSGHIQAIKEILDVAPFHNSLVLIDEICSGTDPVEGQALGIELMLQFVSNGYFGVITSHYSALKNFANDHPKFANGSMVFNTESLQPTYLFRKGIPGSSYALALASRMNLDHSLIEKARIRTGNQHQSLEQMNLELERKLNENVEKQRILVIKEREMDHLENELREKQKLLKQSEKSFKSNLKKQFDAEIDSLKRSIFSELKSLKESKVPDFKKLEEQLYRKVEETKVTASELEEISEAVVFKIGDSVKIKNGTQNGEILQIEGDSAIIQFGPIKMKIGKSELVPYSKKQSKYSDVKQTTAEIKPMESYQSELKLLGLTVSEAIDKLELYLSHAMYNQYPSVKIVHGKGTGALRKAVHQYLTNYPGIKEFHLAEWNEGSTGVTVVIF